jgi:hypothetical protein
MKQSIVGASNVNEMQYVLGRGGPYLSRMF